MVICPDCGKEVPKAKFCKNCGAHIEDVEEVKMESEEIIENVEEDVPAPEVVPVETNTVEVVPVETNTVEVVPSETSTGSSDQDSSNVKYCYNCGYLLEGKFKFCPNCGCDLESPANNVTRSAGVTTRSEKSMIVAIILSVILPGLGQFYLGLDRKGAMFLIGYIISAILILLLIGFLLCTVLWIWALVDTIQSTNALNEGREVEDKLF